MFDIRFYKECKDEFINEKYFIVIKEKNYNLK